MYTLSLNLVWPQGSENEKQEQQDTLLAENKNTENQHIMAGSSTERACSPTLMAYLTEIFTS